MTQITAKCQYTKQNLTEVQKALTRRTAKICSWISLGGGAMLLAGLILEHGELIYFGLFWFVLFWFWRYHAARKSAKASIRHYEKIYGKGTVVETEIRFFTTMFIARNLQAETERRVNYDDLEKIVVTKHLYALVLPDNTAFLADRRLLDGETEQALSELLEEKCTRAIVNV